MRIAEIQLGMPCWFELTSINPCQSSAFLNSLFGWTTQDIPMGSGIYSFLRNSNGTVGAMWEMPKEQKSTGMQSFWSVNFLVADCDQSNERAVSLGAKSIVAPVDAGEHGRMSVLADPGGAMFCLWQSNSHTGDLVMFENYSIGWVELTTRSTQQAREFYGSLFGWDFTESPIPIPNSGNYVEYAIGSTRYGGLLPMNSDWGDMPSHWSIYIPVPGVDACVARTKELGGKVVVSPFDAKGVGRIAMIAEPTGASTYIITLTR
jgi:uncharacterized protein